MFFYPAKLVSSLCDLLMKSSAALEVYWSLIGSVFLLSDDLDEYISLCQYTSQLYKVSSIPGITVNILTNLICSGGEGARSYQ